MYIVPFTNSYILAEAFSVMDLIYMKSPQAIKIKWSES